MVAIPDRFWPNGDLDARPWTQESRQAEWRRACLRSYQRAESENIETFDELMLVTHEESRSSGVVQGPWHSVYAHGWAAVRGTDFVSACSWGLDTGSALEIVVNLVPTPLNPHDPFAVAVEWDGQKLGNLSRSYAAHAHRRLRILNLCGYRTTTAAVVRAFMREEIRVATPEAFVALPTFRRLDSLLPSPEANLESFRLLWAALSAQIRQRIIEDDYHLSERSIRAVVNAALEFPELVIHPKTRLDNFPGEFNYVLRELRLAATEARRAARNAERAAKWQSDSRAVAELNAAGLTRNEIRQTLGLSDNRLRLILRDIG